MGDYRFKCEAARCQQRFKTKQQMQNHQGSIHVNKSSQSGDGAPVEKLSFNRNQLCEDEEKDVAESVDSGVAQAAGVPSGGAEP